MRPFGAWRDNWHAAVIASMIANVNRKQGTAAYKPSDFFYKDAQTAQMEKDAETIAWLDAKVKADGR